MGRAIKWLPQKEIAYPCADISYFWASKKDAEFIVTMHFSRMVDGLENDLEINFGSPMAINWEDESYSLTDFPDGIPKTEKGKFKFLHPTIIVEGSDWAKKYADNKYSDGDPEADDVVHYLLISLNDILHVLSEIEPVTKWIASTDD
jgi:hypothetical protein